MTMCLSFSALSGSILIMGCPVSDLAQDRNPIALKVEALGADLRGPRDHGKSRDNHTLRGQERG